MRPAPRRSRRDRPPTPQLDPCRKTPPPTPAELVWILPGCATDTQSLHAIAIGKMPPPARAPQQKRGGTPSHSYAIEAPPNVRPPQLRPRHRFPLPALPQNRRARPAQPVLRHLKKRNWRTRRLPSGALRPRRRLTVAFFAPPWSAPPRLPRPKRDDRSENPDGCRAFPRRWDRGRRLR